MYSIWSLSPPISTSLLISIQSFAAVDFISFLVKHLCLWLHLFWSLTKWQQTPHLIRTKADLPPPNSRSSCYLFRSLYRVHTFLKEINIDGWKHPSHQWQLIDTIPHLSLIPIKRLSRTTWIDYEGLEGFSEVTSEQLHRSCLKWISQYKERIWSLSSRNRRPNPSELSLQLRWFQPNQSYWQR